MPNPRVSNVRTVHASFSLSELLSHFFCAFVIYLSNPIISIKNILLYKSLVKT